MKPIIVALAPLATLSVQAHASVVKWTITDSGSVLAEDTPVGSWTYDDVNNSYTGVELTLCQNPTDCGAIGPFTFTEAQPGSYSEGMLLATEQYLLCADTLPICDIDITSEVSVMIMGFNQPLNGASPYATEFEGIFFGLDCTPDGGAFSCTPTGGFSMSFGGEASGVTKAATAVPTMSAYGLVLTIFGLVIVATRRLSRRKVNEG
jgi:hypothetical protein